MWFLSCLGWLQSSLPWGLRGSILFAHHWSRMGGFYINGCAIRKTLRWFLRIIIPDSAAFGNMGLASTEGSFTSNRNNHIQECWLFHTSMSKSGLPVLDWFLLKELHYTTTHPPCTWKFVTHDYLPRPKKSRDSSTTNLSHISMLTQLLFTSPFACTIGYLLRCAVLRMAPPFFEDMVDVAPYMSHYSSIAYSHLMKIRVLLSDVHSSVWLMQENYVIPVEDRQETWVDCSLSYLL